MPLQSIVFYLETSTWITKKYDHNYANRPLFEDFDEHLSGKDLVQLVNFDTWSRIVNLTFRSSIIDHVYVKDPTNLSEIERKNYVLVIMT